MIAYINPVLEIEYMGASESGPATDCKVCGKVFRTIEDLTTHNREAHSGSIYLQAPAKAHKK